MAGRFLRSKQLRAALWLLSGGRCRRCGRALDPADWHADHTVPWSADPDTNPHNMQALCPACNSRKGRQMLRQHQREMQAACSEIRAGASQVRRIIAAITPGGGKSFLPVIAASELIGTGRADGVCWVVPRRSLQEQAEDAFLDAHFRRLVPHRHSIRTSTNDIEPARGLAGYVTTYQAIAADGAGINAEEFRRRRYILVLDECHHVEEGGLWAARLQPLVDAAALVVLMTGTLGRGDGKQVAFLPYQKTDGGETVDLTPAPDRAVIRYARDDALRERAVIPLFFSHLDAEAEWLDKAGQRRAVGSLSESGAESGALHTALSTGYATQLLDCAVADWEAFRTVNARSKLLVVAASISAARMMLVHLRRSGVKAAIATSDDGQEALAAIKLFKAHSGPRVDALVTVAMAYEGLDVPQVTH